MKTIIFWVRTLFLLIKVRKCPEPESSSWKLVLELSSSESTWFHLGNCDVSSPKFLQSRKIMLPLISRAAVSIWKPKVTALSDLKPHQLNQVNYREDGQPYIQKTSTGSTHNLWVLLFLLISLFCGDCDAKFWLSKDKMRSKIPNLPPNAHQISDLKSSSTFPLKLDLLVDFRSDHLKLDSPPPQFRIILSHGEFVRLQRLCFNTERLPSCFIIPNHGTVWWNPRHRIFHLKWIEEPR